MIAAVILPQEVFISGLNDSKQLSAVKREQLYDEVLAKALSVSVNVVSISNIDELNIYQATKHSARHRESRKLFQYRPIRSALHLPAPPAA